MTLKLVFFSFIWARKPSDPPQFTSIYTVFSLNFFLSIIHKVSGVNVEHAVSS
jgi:hypothetical protein